MSYRWLEHTAEVELAIDAVDERGAYADTVRAFRELVGRAPSGEPSSRSVEADAPDPSALFAAFIDELVLLAELEGFVADDLVALDLEQTRLRVELSGRLDSPAHVVKGVTLNGLAFVRDELGCHARVVLDV